MRSVAVAGVVPNQSHPPSLPPYSYHHAPYRVGKGIATNVKARAEGEG